MIDPNMKAQHLWSTTLFFPRWPEHEKEAPRIIEFLYQLKSQESENIASGVAPGAKSQQGLFESKFNLFTMDHPGLNKLKVFIGNSLKTAIATVNGSDSDSSRIKVSAVDSWFHITNDGGFHDGHHHHNCSWCGIYYVQAGDVDAADTTGGARNGVNRFYSPIATGGSYWDFGNEYLRTGNFDVTPEDGLLVLFPSFLLHSALAYRGEKDRIVISFNAQAMKG